MKVARSVLAYLSSIGVEYIFGIPAGSVNAIFNELYDMPNIQPVITKHEGGAGYIAAAYAKESGKIGVCIGCSGPGSTNLITCAANAMREHLPLLFLTGHVPVQTVGLNASQELDADPIFRPVTKYSVTVKDPERALEEVARAVEIALSGVPGPVHVSLPVNIQLTDVPLDTLPPAPRARIPLPDYDLVKKASIEIARSHSGFIFVGQGARSAIAEVIEAAEILGWPLITTPQAKGLIPDSHVLHRGVFGFAGHVGASRLVNEGDFEVVLIIGSSLGETATNNYNHALAKGRLLVHIDIDATVFNRVYDTHISLCGDARTTLGWMIQEWSKLGIRADAFSSGNIEVASSVEAEGDDFAVGTVSLIQKEIDEPPSLGTYNTATVLKTLQMLVPSDTRYTVDIGEFMSYVIHHMRVYEPHTFAINVHFGPMGLGICSAIGLKIANSSHPVVCLTGDGCFFMHGMEVLTAKELNLPIIFVVFNNARLGMVFHGHKLQYGRSHACFEQIPVNISALAASMGIYSARVEKIEDLQRGMVRELLSQQGPSVLEIAIVDDNIPPMGDRVKFLSSFGE